MNDFLMDAHMHFDLYNNRRDILSYIESHHSYTIAMTNLPKLYERYYRQYDSYKYIRIALGFHPELAYKYKNQLSIFLKYVDTARYIGEIGLDYSKQDEEEQNVQKLIFTEIINACKKTSDKILSVHSRKAEMDCIRILDGYKGKIVLHWYSGNLQVLRNAVELGCFFSINQQMLLSKNGRNIIASLPVDRILLESDAPFSKGMECKYSFVFAEKVYDFLSETKDISRNTISRTIEENFLALLN